MLYCRQLDFTHFTSHPRRLFTSETSLAFDTALCITTTWLTENLHQQMRFWISATAFFSLSTHNSHRGYLKLHFLQKANSGHLQWHFCESQWIYVHSILDHGYLELKIFLWISEIKTPKYTWSFCPRHNVMTDYVKCSFWLGRIESRISAIHFPPELLNFETAFHWLNEAKLTGKEWIIRP